MHQEHRSWLLAMFAGICFVLCHYWFTASHMLLAVGIIFAHLWALVCYPPHHLSRFQRVLGGGSVGLAVLGAIGTGIPLIVATTREYNQAGQVIQVTNYPMSYVALRICILPALLGLGALLALLAKKERLHTKLILVQALFTIVLGLALALDIYLDSSAPAAYFGLVLCGMAACWGVLALLGQRTAGFGG